MVSPSSSVRITADGVELFEGKPDRIHQLVAGRTRGIGAMLLQSLAQCARQRAAGIVQQRHIGRAAAAGVRRADSPRRTFRA